MAARQGDTRTAARTATQTAARTAARNANGASRQPSQLIETAARMLRANGQRLTVGRVELVRLLADAERPLTIPEVLERDRQLAQSSAYRNLTVLEHAGVVRRVVTHDEFARYELAEDLTGHHHHLVCSTCGRVEDLPASAAIEQSVGAAIDDAALRSGFHVDHHRLDLVGTCADCA